MHRVSSTSAVFASVMAAVVVATIPVFGQAQPQAAGKAASAHVSGGGRDLEGTWAFATVTPLQRPKEFAGKELLTAEEKAKLEEQAVRDQFVDRPAPAGNPGTYNRFWIDAGTKAVATGRTSLIIDPPDGRVPALTPQGRDRQAAFTAKAEAAAGPEDLTTWDRCILGFNAGPPMIWRRLQRLPAARPDGRPRRFAHRDGARCAHCSAHRPPLALIATPPVAGHVEWPVGG